MDTPQAGSQATEPDQNRDQRYIDEFQARTQIVDVAAQISSHFS
jgi:hypothetical protein